MFLNLSDVLSEQHKPIDEEINLHLTAYSTGRDSYRILRKSPLTLHIAHEKERILQIDGRASFVFEVPCDRCLEPVETEVELDFAKRVDLSEADGEQAEEFDESGFIDGYTLDVDVLTNNEIRIGWPTKILCSDDCKGICSTCGQNLNHASCDCESTSLDPRMSVIRDLFQNFKEV